MTPLRILFFGLLGVAVLLYVLNPGPEKFEEFLRGEVARRAAEAAAEAGGAVAGDIGSEMGAFLADRIGREIGGAASQAFERENYYLASIYRVDLNGIQPDGDWAFLGVANWFIPIEQPDRMPEM